MIPVYNEGPLIREVAEPLLQSGYQVVVVDDGSEGGAEQQLAGLAVHLCGLIANLGQGAALQTGMKYALLQGASYLVTFDADGQHRREDIARILQPLRKGACQVTLGSRFAAGGDAAGIPVLRKLLLRAGALLTSSYLRVDITDVTNGLRGFTAEAARQMEITQNRMAHADQTLQLVRERGLTTRRSP